MELLIYVAIFLAGSLVAFLLSKRFYTSKIRYIGNEAHRLQANIFRAHYLYLGLLRREFANAILESNTLLQADKDAKAYEETVEVMSDDEFNTKVSEFWKRYPDIVDFDSIGVKHFIKYSDSFAFDDGGEEARKCYLDIVKYMALLCRLESGTGWNRSIFTGTDIELLEERLSQYDDQRLRKLATEALERKRLNGKSLFDKYEDEEYAMEYLHEASPASFTGIHVMKSNEYVVYESFLSDDNKHYKSFYRSDKGYSKRETLHT